MIRTNKKMVSAMHRAIVEYNMLEEGDKVAVGISGGKDSLTLLACLAQYKKQVKYNFELVAVAVDIFGDSDYSKIEEFCNKLSVKLVVERTNINKVVFEVRQEKNPCSLCANLRRGILNSVAERLDCNKVALGHHADDLVQTFFMSVAKENRLSTFWPKTYLSRKNIYLIRPMIYVWEKAIIENSKNLPIMHNPCTANKNTVREEMKEILEDLDKKIPNFKENLHSSLCHTERYSLLDKCKDEGNNEV